MNTQNKISEEVNKELHKLSPTLAAIPKTNPFSVPEGYFDNLPGAVQNKIKASQKRTRPLYLASWKISLAAASIALLMVTWMVFGPSPDSLPTYSLDEFSAEEIHSLFANDDNFELDESMIVASYIESEAVWDGEDPSLVDEEVIEYLIENDIELDLIINEYNNI